MHGHQPRGSREVVAPWSHFAHRHHGWICPMNPATVMTQEVGDTIVGAAALHLSHLWCPDRCVSMKCQPTFSHKLRLRIANQREYNDAKN